MKYCILVLIILVCGCSSPRQASLASKIKTRAHDSKSSTAGGSLDDISDSTSAIDSTAISTQEPQAEPHPILKDSLSLVEEYAIMESKPVSSDGEKIITSEYAYTSSIKVKNQIKETASPINKGVIAYAVPDSMVVGVQSKVKVRISKEQDTQLLIFGDKKIPIADGKEKTTITIESVRVAPEMSAKLISLDSAIKTHLTSSLTQDIEDKGYTEWEWEITPLSAGSHELKLIVSVISEDHIPKDIVVFDRTIETHSNFSFSAMEFIHNYWHYAMATFIIPIFSWWWKKREKRTETIAATPVDNS